MASMRSRRPRSPEQKALEARRVKEWRRANAKRAYETNRGYIQRMRARIFTVYGAQCGCCGEADRRFLTLDHVNGDGAEARKPHRNNFGELRKAATQGTLFPPDPRYQVLCWNCNCAKSIYGECPHQEGKAKEQSAQHGAEPHS